MAPTKIEAQAVVLNGEATGQTHQDERKNGGKGGQGSHTKTTTRNAKAHHQRPSFNDLPLHPDDPPYSAWGLHGPDDELGTLNLLTPETTKRALQEVLTGRTIPLNLPLDVPSVPMNPARNPLQHRFIAKGHANDDEITLNMQASSQWDGLRHYPYQHSASSNYGDRRFYNGVRQEDLVNADGSCTPILGVQNLAREGIAARSVLLDWATWAQRRGIAYSPFSTHIIPLHELQAVAHEQDVQFRPGDILLIRTGWTEAYNALTPHQRAALAARPTRSFVGVEASDEVFRWHWENGFAAVASDTNAYEAQPFTTARNSAGVSCHEVFLSGWGMSIGELWDLEELAKACEERRRWTFFLTTSPLNLVGAAGSPANAMAIL